jgi:hypothetical protein
MSRTAILTITVGQFQVFQRYSSSKMVQRTVESRFEALKYYENGSMQITKPCLYVYPMYISLHTDTDNIFELSFAFMSAECLHDLLRFQAR